MLFISDRSRPTPTVHFLRIQAAFPAVEAELGDVQINGIEYDREFIDHTPGSGTFSNAGTTSACNTITQDVDSDHMYSQLC